ncbi:MAG: hypothetical protein NT011_07070 [Kiritimatiellaeota bacterium]|nr:hypothetical protein [Kiritimatiellota bacterium]
MLIGLGLTMALAVPLASATNYYVVTSSQQPSPPTSLWTNWGLAHTNLIEVVAAARDYDTVYVTNNAIYYLTNQITVSDAITVRSWGPGGILDPTNTIIDANYPNAATTNRHFTLSNYWATLAGFTLTNGWDTSYESNSASGGSIYIYYGTVSNCIIMRNYALNPHSTYQRAGGGGIFMGLNTANSGGVWNCTISGNSAWKTGGGIIIYNGGPWQVANCTISDNSAIGAANSGGGIFATSSSAAASIISNCWVVSNYSQNYAGGIYLGYPLQCHNSLIMGNTASGYEGGGVRMAGASLLRNCLVVSNFAQAASGGGVYAGNGNPLIQNCTISSNVSGAAGGGFFFSWSDGFPKIENTIIWGNRGSGINSNWYISRTDPALTMVTFTNCLTSPNIVHACASAVNTITNDPRYVNAATGDFRLQSDSPCINAGVNRDWMEGARDFYGNRRIDNFRKTVDIGACEYLGKGTLFRVY